MTPKKIATIGVLLYGSRWKKDLATALGYSRHGMIGVLNEEWSCPPTWKAKIRKLVEKRIAALQGTLKFC